MSRRTTDLAAVAKEQELLKELGIDQWTDEAVADAKDAAEANRRPRHNLGKFVEGKNALRIGPPRAGMGGSPFLCVHIHHEDVPGQSVPAIYACPRLAVDPALRRECFRCKAAERLAASHNTRDQAQAERILPRPFHLFNVVNRLYTTPTWQVGKFGDTQHNKVLRLRDKASGLGVDFTHPIHGQDLLVIRSGVGQNDTRYQEMLDPAGRSPLLPGADVPALKAFLARMHNLMMDAEPMPDDLTKRQLNGDKIEWDAYRADQAARWAGKVLSVGGIAVRDPRQLQHLGQIEDEGPGYDEDGNPL